MHYISVPCVYILILISLKYNCSSNDLQRANHTQTNKKPSDVLVRRAASPASRKTSPVSRKEYPRYRNLRRHTSVRNRLPMKYNKTITHWRWAIFCPFAISFVYSCRSDCTFSPHVMKIICLVLRHFIFVLLFILTFYDTFFLLYYYFRPR
jgi:hypothetical protein